MDFVLIVITVGSFLASFVNAAFATGGVYIMLAAATAVLPVTAAVPLMPTMTFGSLIARIGFFFHEISWPIVVATALGALIGVYLGTKIFVSLDEQIISILLATILLVLTWLPRLGRGIKLKHPFFFVGAIHSFLASMLGVGALLQPTILRTSLTKLQITGTLAACLAFIDVIKLFHFSRLGFNYFDYLPHIVLATIAGFIGTWAGKRVTHHISETTFRLVFKALITLVAIRLLTKALL